MSAMEIHYNDDGWAALYVDGVLDSFNDDNLTEARAMELAGIARVHDEAFMRNTMNDPAPTLAEVHDWQAKTD